jgi:hypothetical protein
MLFSNIFVETSETIKIGKTLSKYQRLYSESSKSSKRTTLKTKTGLDLREKFKAFLIGFLAVIAVKAINEKNGGIVNKMVVAAVDWCFEPTINEYDEVKKKMIKESPCNPEIIKELFGKDYVEVQTKCAQLETARNMDSNEFSGLNVLLGKISGAFTDNTKFEADYAKFKAEKEDLEKFSEKMTETYLKKFKEVKNDKKNTAKPKRKVARTLFKQMDGIIFKKDLCGAVKDCNPFGPVDNLKVVYGTSIGFLKCAVTAQVKNPLWYGLQGVVTSIFNQLGVGFLTNLAAGIFPGILLGLLVKFVISNWSAMKQFIDSFLTLKIDDESAWNAERDLFNSIGRLLAGLLFLLIGARRRKLKKFRKFDTKLF